MFQTFQLNKNCIANQCISWTVSHQRNTVAHGLGQSGTLMLATHESITYSSGCGNGFLLELARIAEDLQHGDTCP